MTDFEEHLTGSQICVLAFASGGQRFEWGGTLSRLNLSHILFRDSTDRWYQRGVAGIGGAAAVVAYITILARTHARIVALGLSSGSYAALMYGLLGGADEVIAISPITGKGEDVFPDFGPEWHHRVEHGPEHPFVPDLKALFLSPSLVPPKIRAFVSDGEGTELDCGMATRIRIKDVTTVPGHSHSGLARAMRDNGMIENLLRGRR